MWDTNTFTTKGDLPAVGYLNNPTMIGVKCIRYSFKTLDYITTPRHLDVKCDLTIGNKYISISTYGIRSRFYCRRIFLNREDYKSNVVCRF